jgi:DNA mismatch endonuclease (patch repair protein)
MSEGQPPANAGAVNDRTGRWGSVPASRRRIMQSNRRRDTGLEKAVRSALFARGLRYRVDMSVRLSEGRPIRVDVVFPRKRIAVFIDGCFWHGCPTHGTQPSTNKEYWRSKIDENRARDRRQTHALQNDGWTVIRIWEHERPASAAETVANAFRGDAQT